MRVPVRTLAAFIAVASAVGVAPAPAQAAAAGAVVFEGTVTLPVFPCTVGPPTCVVTFNATTAAGVVNGSVVGGLSATVNYNEPACVAGQAATGTAAGTATLTGANVVGTTLPASASFEWTRVGLVAVVTWPLSTPPAPFAVQYLVGAALFVPTGGAPTCTGGALTATVAGAVVLVP